MTTARDTADRLFSELVRSRGACEFCGVTVDLQCAHIFSRRFTATRTDEANALCLCARHHQWFTEHPAAWWQRVRLVLGADAFDALERKAHTEARKFDWSAEVKRLRGRLLEVAA